MWIKQIPDDFKERRSYAFDVIFLWKNQKRPIYVMDNHLCAAWCWMQECNSKEDYNFMHIDRHSDLKGCGHPMAIDFIRQKQHLTFEDYMAVLYSNGSDNIQFFQWDNYIRACHHLFPNWFNVNLFYTHDYNDCYDNEWGYKSFPIQSMNILNVGHDLTQYIEEHNKCLCYLDKDNWSNKWILNIDLDYIWDSEGIKIFDEDFIRDFAKRINMAMDNIQVITIALSPDCIGGDRMYQKWENVIRVFNILRQEIDGLEECEIKP